MIAIGENGACIGGRYWGLYYFTLQVFKLQINMQIVWRYIALLALAPQFKISGSNSLIDCP